MYVYVYKNKGTGMICGYVDNINLHGCGTDQLLLSMNMIGCSEKRCNELLKDIRHNPGLSLVQVLKVLWLCRVYECGFYEAYERIVNF